METKSVARLALLCAAGLLLQACTITRLDRGNGQVETTYALLAPVTHVSIPPEGAYLETRGVGLAAISGQTAIGLFDIKALGISRDCRLVVISDSDKVGDAWRDLLKDSGPVCSPAKPRGDGKP